MEEFEDKTKDKEENKEEEKIVTRARLPRENEVIGIIEERLGGNRAGIHCMDGKNRNCRVPGRLKRRLWIRPGDVVIVQPWEFDNSKGDIIFKYRSSQIEWLKRNNYLKESEAEF